MILEMWVITGGLVDAKQSRIHFVGELLDEFLASLQWARVVTISYREVDKSFSLCHFFVDSDDEYGVL